AVTCSPLRTGNPEAWRCESMTATLEAPPARNEASSAISAGTAIVRHSRAVTRTLSKVLTGDGFTLQYELSHVTPDHRLAALMTAPTTIKQRLDARRI